MKRPPLSDFIGRPIPNFRIDEAIGECLCFPPALPAYFHGLHFSLSLYSILCAAKGQNVMGLKIANANGRFWLADSRFEEIIKERGSEAHLP